MAGMLTAFKFCSSDFFFYTYLIKMNTLNQQPYYMNICIQKNLNSHCLSGLQAKSLTIKQQDLSHQRSTLFHSGWYSVTNLLCGVAWRHEGVEYTDCHLYTELQSYPISTSFELLWKMGPVEWDRAIYPPAIFSRGFACNQHTHLISTILLSPSRTSTHSRDGAHRCIGLKRGPK